MGHWRVRYQAEEKPLTVAEKFKIACELHEFGVELMRQNLIRDFGRRGVERRLQAWLADSQQGPGTPRRVVESENP